MSICHCCLSVCLKMPVLRIQAILLVLNSFKLYKALKNRLACLCFFLLDTLLYKRCVLSWHHGHAYQPHPDIWPRVQLERMVSVFLGSTIQRAFVRRWFVPVLMEALHCTCIATCMVWLYRALIHLHLLQIKLELSPYLSSLVDSKTSDNGPSEKRTTSVQWTAHLPPIAFTIEIAHFEPPRSGHLSTPNNRH